MLVLQSGWNIRRFPVSRWCLLWKMLYIQWDKFIWSCGRKVNEQSAQEDLLPLPLSSPLYKTSIHRHFAHNPTVRWILLKLCLYFRFRPNSSVFIFQLPPNSTTSTHISPIYCITVQSQICCHHSTWQLPLPTQLVWPSLSMRWSCLLTPGSALTLNLRYVRISTKSFVTSSKAHPLFHLYVM